VIESIEPPAVIVDFHASITTGRILSKSNRSPLIAHGG
jgi:hypothetical protein